jgi:2-polyprenyl-3-methyl-5-hydroxy-6-metoxy-1,4-benzoquinol methylase
VNDDEISHFSRLSAQWWDESGEFALLHKMNPHRIRFIREKLLEASQTHPDADATTTATANTISSNPTQSLESPRVMEGMDVLDVRYGGGILSEVRFINHMPFFIRFIDGLYPEIESRASRRQYARHRRIGRGHWYHDASCRCGS